VAAGHHGTSGEPADEGLHTMSDVWSRIGVVAVVLAVGVTTPSCADDGPVDRADGPVGSPAPGVAVAETDVVAAAVALRVSACRPVVERGAGLLVAPGQVLTSAHVVAGASSILVINATGVTVEASVVAFDPVNDLAVVAVPPSFGPHVPLAAVAPEDAFTGEVVLFRQDRAVLEPVEILRRVTINTDDIYRAEITSRPGYELHAKILPGDSGGVIVHEGEAVGVVWSRSRISNDRAWAIDPVRGGATISDQLSAGQLADDIDLGRCS
jgi:S1-C subfamily serine protease